MPKLKITIGSTITYSDSNGRKYVGPLKGAPDYVQAAAKEMNDLMQDLDDTFTSLVNSSNKSATKSYKMTIGRAFDWWPLILIVVMGLMTAVLVCMTYLAVE